MTLTKDKLWLAQDDFSPLSLVYMVSYVVMFPHICILDGV